MGLWWLYLTYGVIGGVGLGSAYIVPVAVLVKRFPDRRALITGIAVGGFGAGALMDGAGGGPTDPERRSPSDVRLSGRSISDRNDGARLLLAAQAGSG